MEKEQPSEQSSAQRGRKGKDHRLLQQRFLHSVQFCFRFHQKVRRRFHFGIVGSDADRIGRKNIGRSARRAENAAAARGAHLYRRESRQGTFIRGYKKTARGVAAGNRFPLCQNAFSARRRHDGIQRERRKADIQLRARGRRFRFSSFHRAETFRADLFHAVRAGERSE